MTLVRTRHDDRWRVGSAQPVRCQSSGFKLCSSCLAHPVSVPVHCRDCLPLPSPRSHATLPAPFASVDSILYGGVRTQSAISQVSTLSRTFRRGVLSQSVRVLSRLAKHGAHTTRQRPTASQTASRRTISLPIAHRLTHTHTTLHAQALIITVPSLLPPERWCRSRFTPATDPFLQVSHIPQSAPICSLTGPTTRR